MKFYIKIYIYKNYSMHFINFLWESILLKQLAAVFIGHEGSKTPSSGLTKPRSYRDYVSIPSVRHVLIHCIRRRCCHYPYSHVLFILVAKGLEVRAQYFSVFVRPPSNHFPLDLLLLHGCMWSCTRIRICLHTDTRIRTSAYAHSSLRAPIYFIL